MDPVDVTAVVLNYRTSEGTVACLRSIADEGIRRVVLVENSEDDGRSHAAMRGGLQELRLRGVDVHVIDDGRNLGFAAGVNRALAFMLQNESRMRPTLLVNSDVHLMHGALCGLLRALDDGIDVAAPEIISESGAAAPRMYYQRLFGLLTRRPIPGAFSYLTGACLLLSPAILRTDLFDNEFFFYGEDVALSAHLARAGCTSTVVAASSITHEGASSAKRGSIFYEYHINRGHWLLARKLSRGPLDHGILLAGRALVLPVRAVYRSIRLATLAPLLGLWRSLFDVALSRSVRRNGVIWG